jgi:hypothetical protein
LACYPFSERFGHDLLSLYASVEREFSDFQPEITGYPRAGLNGAILFAGLSGYVHNQSMRPSAQ